MADNGCGMAVRALESSNGKTPPHRVCRRIDDIGWAAVYLAKARVGYTSTKVAKVVARVE